MKEETLKLIGRRHTVEQVKEAYALAREIGFDNINMDLILGLPNETREDVEETLRQVKTLNPDSLTVHSLAIKRASKMSQWIIEQGIQCLNNTDETMESSANAAEEMQMSLCDLKKKIYKCIYAYKILRQVQQKLSMITHAEVEWR